MILKSQFYNQPTIKVAQDLLGCFLVRELPTKSPLLTKKTRPPRYAKHCGQGAGVRYKIVETEAYDGPNDLASHASRGKTARNQVMFGRPGTIYVYFTYGMHYMLNIVTEKVGYPAAVLIRAIEPISPPLLTKETRLPRYAKHCGQGAGVRLKTNGPARLTKALHIDKTFNGFSVCTKKYGLWIEGPPSLKLRRTSRGDKKQIVRAKRVGVDYAGEYKNKLWRFYIRGNPFVSKK